MKSLHHLPLVLIVLLYNFFLTEVLLSSNDYIVTEHHLSGINSNTFNAKLQYTGKGFNNTDYEVDHLRNSNIDITKNLDFTARLEYNKIMHISLRDLNTKRWEVANTLLSPDYIKKADNYQSSDIMKSGFKFTEAPFGFSYKPNNSDLFSFGGESKKLMFSDYLILFESILTTGDIFGWGERIHKFKLQPGRYTTWPNDSSNILDDGQGGKNLYGVQPFYLHRSQSGLFMGMLFLNINAQDLFIKELLSKMYSLEHRTIGGIIDIFIMTGKTPDEVLQQYHEVIGFAQVPPLWTLGWQQCKFGYRNDTYLDEIQTKYEEHELPMDVVWTDIDYMEDYRDFTIAKKRYPNLPSLVDKYHRQEKYYMPIIDIGIPKNTTDKYYNKGMEMDLFIKSNYTGEPLVNIVWPGKCVFPDWFHPNTTLYWHEGLSEINSKLDLDGIWLDMNEPSVKYDVGEIDAVLDPKKNMFNDIPYIPGSPHSDLVSRQISVNAKNYKFDQINNPHMTIFNTKPLTPYYQTMETHSYLSSVDKRPFILSRSSIVGMSKFAIHWLGDNYSTYESMKLSLSGVYSFQMFGYAMVGADICGFNANAWDTICARWHVLGAFYPFSRNHSNRDAISQEPFNIGPITLEATKTALSIRYSIIRYLYSQIFLASIRGGSIFKPEFFVFPEDNELYKDWNMDSSFMLGNALRITPVYSDTEEDILTYFPNANWNYLNGDLRKQYNSPTSNSNNSNTTNLYPGSYESLSGKFNNVNIFIKGGSILPRQETVLPTKVLRTNELRRRPTELLISLDHNKEAVGEIIFDDGYNRDSVKNKDYYHAEIEYKNNALKFNVINSMKTEYKYKDNIISKVEIFNYVMPMNNMNKNLYGIVVIKTDGTVLTDKDSNQEFSVTSYCNIKNKKLTIELEKPLNMFEVKEIRLTNSTENSNEEEILKFLE